MKQTIHPAMFVTVLAVLVILVGALATWVWTRPTSALDAAAAGGSQSKEGGGSKTLNIKSEHGGPTADQMQQIQEWKRSHPGSATKY